MFNKKEIDKITQKIINLSGETGILFKELDKIAPCYECKHLIYKNEEDCEKTVISNTVAGQTFENIQRKYYCPKCFIDKKKSEMREKEILTIIVHSNVSDAYGVGCSTSTIKKQTQKKVNNKK